MPWLFVKSRASWKPTGSSNPRSQPGIRAPTHSTRSTSTSPSRPLRRRSFVSPRSGQAARPVRSLCTPEIGVHSYVTSCTERDEHGLHQVTGRVEVVPYKGDNPLYRHEPFASHATGGTSSMPTARRSSGLATPGGWACANDSSGPRRFEPSPRTARRRVSRSSRSWLDCEAGGVKRPVGSGRVSQEAGGVKRPVGSEAGGVKRPVGSGRVSS